MAASNVAKLYTPDILALAVDLANYPITDVQSLKAEVRSRSCGSSLVLSIEPGTNGQISSLGLQVSACAVGQASAAIFARSAKGKSLGAIEQNMSMLVSWLTAVNEAPDWPGVDRLEAARTYPARHEAILLPWRAAIAALSKADPHR